MLDCSAALQGSCMLVVCCTVCWHTLQGSKCWRIGPYALHCSCSFALLEPLQLLLLCKGHCWQLSPTTAPLLQCLRQWWMLCVLYDGFVLFCMLLQACTPHLLPRWTLPACTPASTGPITCAIRHWCTQVAEHIVQEVVKPQQPRIVDL